VLTWPTKDPDEVLDYNVNWTDRLEVGETIVASFFSVAEGDVVIDDDDELNGVCTVWLSGGTAGTVAIILNRIETSEGRTYDQSVKLRIRSK
jgi:hypothetical protein